MVADDKFFRSEQPLKAWAVISFDRFLDQDDMKRYITYLCQTLGQHGVPIDNARPECFGPIDPRPEGNVESALQQAARSAYRVGKCPPQLICIVLPGRYAKQIFHHPHLRSKLIFQGCVAV